MKSTLIILVCTLAFWTQAALATSIYEYRADEYVTISKGMSPDGKYAITAHGTGEMGYDHFHLFLTDAVAGKKIGPLTEITDVLDTGAEAYAAKWSQDSQRVEIVYRIDRHKPLLVISYRVAKGRAFRITGPVSASKEQVEYWGKYGAGAEPSHEKTFGTPKADKPAGG